jgi:hypothetical protein
MKLEPGYDGEPPIVIELRDLGSAKNKRRLIMRVKPGMWNKRLNRGVIAAYQKEAVDRLEDDWNSALRIAFASAGGGLGAAAHASGPQQSKLEADERIRSAREAVIVEAGAVCWQVVDYAVMFDYTFELIARKLKCRRQNVVLHLRRGLDALARHYGMAS